MNKKTLKNSLLVLSSIVLLASCGGGNGGGDTPKDDELWICAYNGGYGDAWLESMTKEFETKTGIKVVYRTDTSLLEKLENDLKNGSDFDLYMSHDIPWQRYAASGYLATMDDLYETKIDGYGDKTFKDRLVDGAAEISSLSVNGETHYYKSCWTQGAGGFVYNATMFQENGWSVPTTYDELVTLCQTINDAKLTVSGSREKVKPFTWSGSQRQYYWDYPVFEWWYQLAGGEKFNTIKQFKGADGSYSTGYEMYNPDTNYKEFWKAYDMWFNLIGNNSENSVTNSASKTLPQAQADFILGKAAMIPYAQWAKYELEKTAEGELDFQYAMMPTPKATASSESVNFMVGFGDSMIIPAQSTHQDLAKKFLAYMASADGCKTFVDKAEGAFLAFDYKDVDLSSIESKDLYTKSVHEKLSAKNINIVSTNPITYLTTNKVMPWIGNTYYYDKCAADSDKSAYTSAALGKTVYETAKSGWKSWMNSAGLKD